MIASPATPRPSRLFAVLAALALAWLGLITGHYLGFAGYFDHGEVNVAFRAWRLVQGLPLYLLPEAPDYLLTVYGPTVYLANGAMLGLWGGSIAASKAAGIAAAFLAVLTFGLHVRGRFGTAWIGYGLVLFLGLQMMAAPFPYWSRADPLSILAVTLGLAAGARLAEPDRPWWAAPLAIGLCCGVAMNVKIHAFLYFFPLLVRFAGRRWLVAWPLAGLAAVLALLAPFALAAFPLGPYVEGVLKVVSVRGIDTKLLLNSLQHILPLMAPLPLMLLAFWRGRVARADALYVSALTLAILAGLYPASVAGSSWYQLIPFLPLAVDATLRMLAALGLAQRQRDAIAWGVALLVIALALVPQRRGLRYITERGWMAEAAAEIDAVMAAHPGRPIEMGFGKDVAERYRVTFLKPMLAYAGHPVTFDGWSDMEADFVGRPPSAARLKRLQDCATPLWLIPAGEAPFAMPSVFSGRDFLAPYRAVFRERYERRRGGQYFDLWECRPVG